MFKAKYLFVLGLFCGFAASSLIADEKPFEELPVLNESGQQEGCIYRFRGSCFKSLDAFENFLLRQLDLKIPKNHPMRITIFQEEEGKTCDGFYFDGRCFVSQKPLIRYLIAKLDKIKSNQVTFYDADTNKPFAPGFFPTSYREMMAKLPVPNTPPRPSNLEKGEISGRWAVSGFDDKVKANVSFNLLLGQRKIKAKKEGGEEFVFYPVINTQEVIDRIKTYGMGEKSLKEARSLVGLFVGKNGTQTFSMFAVHLNDEGQLKSEETKIRESYENVLRFGSDIKKDFRMEHFGNAPEEP